MASKVTTASTTQINVANNTLSNDVYNKEAAALELIANDTKRILKATEAIIKLRLLQLKELRELRNSK